MPQDIDTGLVTLIIRRATTLMFGAISDITVIAGMATDTEVDVPITQGVPSTPDTNFTNAEVIFYTDSTGTTVAAETTELANQDTSTETYATIVDTSYDADTDELTIVIDVSDVVLDSTAGADERMYFIVRVEQPDA